MGDFKLFVSRRETFLSDTPRTGVMAKLLIVDDSSLMLSVIRNFAGKAGKDLEIFEAKDGDEALQIFEAEKPELTFLDIKMPGLDGLDVLDRMQGMAPQCKVVMCTSMKEKAQEDRARAAGAVGYIMKPFRSDDIIGAINEHIN
jgi:CheY-like chemotaxis protein